MESETSRAGNVGISSPRGGLDRVLPSLQSAAPRIPAPTPFWPLFLHLTCVPQYGGHPLHSRLAASFCQNPVSLTHISLATTGVPVAWQPH